MAAKGQLKPTYKKLLETPLREKYGDDLDGVYWRKTPEGRHYILGWGIKSYGILRNDGLKDFSFHHFIKDLPEHIKVVDWETTSLNPFGAIPIGLSVADRHGTSYITPYPEEEHTAAGDGFSFLRAVCEDCELVFHNGKYDLQIIKVKQPKLYDRIKNAGMVHDTMLMSYVLDPSRFAHGMDILAREFLNYETITHEDLCGKRENPFRNFKDVPHLVQRDYSMEDAAVTGALYKVFMPRLQADKDLMAVYDMERKLLFEIAELELNGIQLDVPKLVKLEEDLDLSLDVLMVQLQSMARPHLRSLRILQADWERVDRWAREERGEFRGRGRLRVKPKVPEFNPDSGEQVGEMLFKVYGLPPDRFKTKTEQDRTDVEVLNKLRLKADGEARIFVELMLDYRDQKKVHSTYVVPFLKNCDYFGRLRGTTKQTGTRTGRLASKSPNMQNIARKGEWATRLRECIVPMPGYKLASLDYSQLEYRLLAHYSRDKKLVEAYRSGKSDMHQITAEALGINRDASKTVNFLVLYQGSAMRLQQSLMADLGLDFPIGRCERFIRGVLDGMPGVKEWIGATKRLAAELGFVRTCIRRVLPLTGLPDPMKKCINWPIQGSGGEVIRRAMIRVGVNNHWPKWRMVLSVHDDLTFEVRNDCLMEWYTTVAFEMREVAKDFGLRVPLEVEAKVGDTWADQIKYKP